MSITNCCSHCEAIFKIHIANLCFHCKNLIQNAYCQFYAVIARILFKMRIAILCCHCKNFIQNAFFKVMLSLQEFYSKCILLNCSVIARILCQTRIANPCCHCKNFIYTIHCNHSWGFFFKIMQQALKTEPSAVPQWYFQLSCTIS